MSPSDATDLFYTIFSVEQQEVFNNLRQLEGKMGVKRIGYQCSFGGLVPQLDKFIVYYGSNTLDYMVKSLAKRYGAEYNVDFVREPKFYSPIHNPSLWQIPDTVQAEGRADRVEN